MPGSVAPVGTAAGLPVGEAGAVDPAWQPWLDLLEIAFEEPGDAWASAVRLRDDRPAGAPLLHGAVLHIDAQRATSLVKRIAEAAGISSGCDVDALEMIHAALTRDVARLAAMADDVAVSAEAFAVVAQSAAIPLLRAVARKMDARGASAWQRSYCPVCGARPSLAEVRGIERERRLRCGCCGADWPLQVLHCAFCDETDHEKLGTLRAEDDEQHRHVETCDSCRGYLKAAMTFDALSFQSLMLIDLSTIPLDLVAHERGFERPAEPGWAPDVEVVS